MTVKVEQIQVQQKQPAVFTSQVWVKEGTLANKASFDKIKAVVIKSDGDGTPTVDEDLTPNDVMFDDLQGTPDNPDIRWERQYTSPDGYNFLWICPGTAFPEKGHYRIEIHFAKGNENQGSVIYEGPALSTLA